MEGHGTTVGRGRIGKLGEAGAGPGGRLWGPHSSESVVTRKPPEHSSCGKVGLFLESEASEGSRGSDSVEFPLSAELH